MNQAVKPDFNAAAADWDARPQRTEMSRRVAAALTAAIPLQPHWRVLDYGCATGLVAFLLHDRVTQLTASDAAAGMLERVGEKLASNGVTNVDLLRLDLEREAPPARAFDLIYCSMTLHHVSEPKVVVKKLAAMLAPGGVLCIIDLEREDGSFHRSAEYVPHCGFRPEAIEELLAEADLTAIRSGPAFTVRREVETGGEREFPLFIATGAKGN